MPVKNENDAGITQSEKNAPASGLSGRHILIVDNVDTNRMIVRLLLAKTDIVVDEAEGGEAALEMFAKSPEGYYDAVFMDIQMPDMDGFEATRRLREMPRPDALKTPVIAMTADAYEDIEESGRAEMNGYLAKPIDINEMKKLLNKIAASRISP
jgi:CheY-like chemotaxis protein